MSTAPDSVAKGWPMGPPGTSTVPTVTPGA
jgi:hypothetical protein